MARLTRVMGQFTKPQRAFLSARAKEIAKVEGTSVSMARALREIVSAAMDTQGKGGVSDGH